MQRCYHKTTWVDLSKGRRWSSALATLLSLTLLLGAGTSSETLETARAKLAKGDPIAAVSILEAALPKLKGKTKAIQTERLAVLKQLRVAYQSAAKFCDDAGKPDDAQEYRDNLEILNRSANVNTAKTDPPPLPTAETQAGKTETAAVPSAKSAEKDASAATLIPLPSNPTADLLENGGKPSETVKDAAAATTAEDENAPANPPLPLIIDDPQPPAAVEPATDAAKAPANADAPLEFVAPKPDPGPIAAPTTPREAPKPGFLVGASNSDEAKPEKSPQARIPSRTMPAVSPGVEAPNDPSLTTVQGPGNAAGKVPTVADADAAFSAKRYDEAGSIYKALDKAGTMPANRRDAWGYCRAIEVVNKINAKPSTQAEWDAINREIEEVRKLSPKKWFAEYLRKWVAERNPNANGNAKPKLKLKLGARTKAKAMADGLVVRGSSPEEMPLPLPQSPATVADADAPVETANFRVIHRDRALAERIAKGAESARQAQVTRWTGQLAAEPWTPRCDIFLYADAETFSRETGQPKDSPGFSTMGMNSGRIVSRRINLRADHPNVLKAILPHEVTHVVLADLFPTQQIPRWADEGVSVLSEPAAEQAVRAAELDEPLSQGRLFRLSDLMKMDYPDAQYWGLYYAQSVSLTRFLVETGTPLQFVTFVKAAQQNGTDNALKQVYKIQGDADLQSKWLTYAKGRSAKAIAAAKANSATEEVAEKEPEPATIPR